MSHVWWKILVRKSPLYDRVDRNRQLLEYLRSTGQDPEPTRLRQTNMGQEQKKPKKPKSAVGQEVGYSFPRLNNPELKGGPFNDKKYHSEFKNKNFTHFYESPDKKVRAGIKHLGDNRYAVDHYGVREDEQEAGVGREGLSQLRSELEAHHGGPVEMTPTSITPSSQGFWDKMNSENITNMLKGDNNCPTPSKKAYGSEEEAYQDASLMSMSISVYPCICGAYHFTSGMNKMVIKEAKSPKALAHKRKYETEYESSPARKKYRRELEGERRKRGVAGKGGGDMSHTKTGKIVVEDPHTNRARSHPSVGSTLKMVVVKAPLYDTATGKQVAGVPTPAPPKYDPNPNFEYDFSNAGGDGVEANGRFLYHSPDQKVRAIVESNGKHATIPLFATHNDARYKGRGREALRDIKTELRSIHPNVEHIEPTGVTAEALGFWNKMHEEGLIDYGGDKQPIANIDRETGEPFERGEPMDIAMRLLKEQKQLFVQGQKTLDGRPAFAPTDFAAEEQRKQAALKEQQKRESREAQRRKNAEGFTPLPIQQNPE